MRVFVTGAAGFIGAALTRDLIAHGHQVVGLARSDANVALLEHLGASVQRGALTELDSLRQGAAQADGVIHLAFIHDFATFAENGRIDKHAIEAMGDAMVGTDKPLIVTSGVAAITPGEVVTEDVRHEVGAHLPRMSEQVGLAYATRGVRAMAVRLPQVHGQPGKAGLISYLLEGVRLNGAAAFVGDGAARWAAAHRSDVVGVYRLALEGGATNQIYHAVGEEGVPIREIMAVIGHALDVPSVSIEPEEAARYYGAMAMFVGIDMPASSAWTQATLGWTPVGPGLIADIGQPGYFR